MLRGLILWRILTLKLGCPVQRRIARVQPHRAGPRTHMMLTVPTDGIDYLADVGFGAGMLYPMPLRDGAVVDQAGWDHRLTRDGAGHCRSAPKTAGNPCMPSTTYRSAPSITLSPTTTPRLIPARRSPVG